MELRIVEDRQNPLLGRREIRFEINQRGNLTRQDVRKALAAHLGVDENLLIVDKILYVFGGGKIVGKAKIYESRDILERIEPEHKIKRNFGGGESGEEGAE